LLEKSPTASEFRAGTLARVSRVVKLGPAGPRGLKGFAASSAAKIGVPSRAWVVRTRRVVMGAVEGPVFAGKADIVDLG